MTLATHSAASRLGGGGAIDKALDKGYGSSRLVPRYKLSIIAILSA